MSGLRVPEKTLRLQWPNKTAAPVFQAAQA